MKMTPAKCLSAEQTRLFLDRGYLKVPDAVPQAVVSEWVASAWQRAGVDPARRETWPKGGTMLEVSRSALISELSPSLWGLVCDLVGGEERIDEPRTHSVSDAFLFNFPVTEEERAKQDFAGVAHVLHLKDWHKDFPRGGTHFLDSRESALLVFVLWTDTDGEGQGATELACDSVGVMAQEMLKRPEGFVNKGLQAHKLVEECRRFDWAYGRAGTVYLVHPFMLHRSAWNVSQQARIMTNRTVCLKEPLDFDRRGAAGYSPVEAAVLRALGRERLEFRRAVLA